MVAGKSARPTAGQRVNMTLPQATEAATSAYSQGDFKRAETILRAILSMLPAHAPSLHLLGIIKFESGEIESGIELVRSASDSVPANGQFAANLAELCRRAGRLEEAVAAGQRAVAAAPGLAVAHSNLGIAYYDLGDFDRAEACQRTALTLEPNLATALNNLGSIHREHNRLSEAIVCYRQVFAKHPDYLEAASNLGSCLLENEQPDEAISVLEPLAAQNPNYADALSNLANAYAAVHKPEKAIPLFERALKIRPGYFEANLGMARVLHELRRVTEALRYAERALALKPQKSEAHAVMGGVLSEAGYPVKAEAAYLRALELDPSSVGAHMGYGHLLMELGRMEAAEKSFRAALALAPDRLGPLLPLVQMTRIKSDDAILSAILKEAENVAAMPAEKAIPLHFAAGKCHEDLGNADRAFSHYSAGCRLKRHTLSYSADETDLTVDNIIRIFTPEAISRLQGGGCDSELPVFVLGMPRSGTTLTETILGSHPKVFAAGELPDLLQIAATPRMVGGPGYPLSVEGVTKAELRVMGQRYVDGLKERCPDAHRITDKMPANFNALGLVHLMLPRARVVHVKRDPVDTCLSNFTRLFGRSQFHSYDLIELGRYYRAYARLMDHWRAVLPAGSFYEIQYEALVAEPELEVRKLLAACRLDWDDACLNFHEAERSVKTASIMQVRRPMYNTSVQKWRQYERHLGPLLDVLGDLVAN